MITKRQLGIGLILAGIGLATAMLLYDLIGLSDFDGVGPLQLNLIYGAGALIVLGVPLLRLGDKPA